MAEGFAGAMFCPELLLSLPLLFPLLFPEESPLLPEWMPSPDTVCGFPDWTPPPSTGLPPLRTGSAEP